MTVIESPPRDPSRRWQGLKASLPTLVQIGVIVGLSISLVTLRFIGETRRMPQSAGDVLTWITARP